MKKILQVFSMILALSLVFSVFGNTAAFAAEEETQITFSDEFNALETLDLYSMYYGMEATVSDSQLTLTGESSDPAVVDVVLEDVENGSYYFDVAAMGKGQATLTFTASDGTTVSKTLTVDGTGELPYTITTDVEGDYSLAKGSSNIIKLHYEDNDTFSIPYLAAEDGSVLNLELMDYDEANGDFYYRVDAVGDVGTSTALYTGAIGYVPQKLCNVSVIENEILHIDTAGQYLCNVNDEYTFVVTSNLPSIEHSITTSREGAVEITPVAHVGNQYTYKVKALEPGTTLITVKLSEETASFYVTANEEDDFPVVTTEDEENITLEQGQSYTYKLSIMGGGVPVVAADTAGVVSVQFEKKEGIDYYYKVTAVSPTDAETGLTVSFPDSEYASDYTYQFSSVTAKPGNNVPTSDTNTDFSLKQGESYTFRLTNAASFNPGSNGVFKVEKVKSEGNITDYKITAIGQPGQSAGFYMAGAGQAAKKVCVVTVAAAVEPTSDTNYDFTVKQGASYTFKISNAVSFYPGSNDVFKTEKVGTGSNYALYKITPIGQPGQSAGFYMAGAGQAAKKVCVVTVGAAPEAQSDTNNDFTLKQGASYTFKISNAISFNPGSNGVFKTEKVKTEGSNVYYKITAIGQPGQSAGFYMTGADKVAKKVCAVTVGAAATPTLKSDTNSNFSIAKSASYQFKITAPGASSVNFNTGSAGVFQVTLLRHTGDDFFYKITAIGKSGQQSGIYASLPGQSAQKLCVVTIS
ncbi:hypothetical protein [Caproiciproducens faecalis]|uniref:Uncharacterized protein n=1 Tax=Caproiciproducens faecalis TaxID=2820301 RepID=A0ABS7DPR4_9FIRM|nr:hypothetical protein [Caproiciproducens faecalis]MBW7572551.1 hypothetical protein [Caproiciproducens faecalis]